MCISPTPSTRQLAEGRDYVSPECYLSFLFSRSFSLEPACRKKYMLLETRQQTRVAPKELAKTHFNWKKKNKRKTIFHEGEQEYKWHKNIHLELG